MSFHSVLSISRSITSSTMSTFRIALVQLKVTPDKAKNVENAVNFVCAAKKNSADIVVLPEIFNSPYGTKYFPLYAEEVPNGDTCKRLSQCAKENKIFIVGGSIPEKEDNRLYNTCTVWNPLGQLVAKHRKIHLFDIDIPGRMTFKESDALSAGQDITTFQVDKLKIGIGICYDIRFPELANIYRKEGCNVIIYPGAFNMTTGPLHWKLLVRARACDNQVYVAAVSPASDTKLEYVAYGHTMLVNPMGEVEVEAEEEETILYKDIDLKKVVETRDQIPILKQRRTDIYDVVYKGK